jgi:anti-sigma factor RsiW
VNEERPYVTCRELVELLDDYVAGQLPPAQLEEFERHIAVCPMCVAYIDSYRKTIALARSLRESDDAPPPGVPEELVQAVLSARRSGR